MSLKTPTVKKPSLLSSFSISDREEEKVIEEALTTPYEKVIKILLNLKKYLEFNKSNNLIINDLTWVIDRIQSHTLYTYEMIDNASELQKYSKTSHEIKSFLDYLNNYSETKEITRRNKASKFQTVKETEKFDFHKAPKSSRHEPPSIAIKLSERHKTLHKSLTNNIESTQIMAIDESPTEYFNQLREIGELNIGENNLQDNCLALNNYSADIVLDKDFDIFEFSKNVGRQNTLLFGAKALIEHLDIDIFLNADKLPNFLRGVKDRYVENTPYHNDLHGLDVCLTVGTYINYSNLSKILYLTELDLTAMLIGSLVHDMAHPGLANGFQINSYSDLAVTYNDVSVLENFHISETFKMLRNPDLDIFSKLSKDDFKIMRRRIIESILATDMTHHAKINSTVKNKLQSNNIGKGENTNLIVDTASKTFLDDQQAIINFLIHTADLSHNSKKFELSYKWTFMLMDEFWAQGDLEKSMNLSVSFLCERKDSDVPKSQIGFIKGIIIPTFDILIDILPSLSFYKQNVEQNLDEWAKIIAERDKNQNKLAN